MARFPSPPQELEQQFERERLSLEEQKTLLMQQLEELRQELSAKLAAAHQQVRLCPPPQGGFTLPNELSGGEPVAGTGPVEMEMVVVEVLT